MTLRARAAATVVLILFVGIALSWLGAGEESVWAVVERRDLVITVPVEGVLEAVESAGITPPAVPQLWNYKILMLAPEGAEVQEGQPVVGFDTRELRQQLRTYVGERDSSASELEKRQSELEIESQNLELEVAEAEARLRRLELRSEIPESLVAERDSETARIDRDLSRAEVESLRERLELLARRSGAEIAALRRRHDRAAQRVEEVKKIVATMQVKAPRNGTIIYTQQRGEKPRVGESVWRGRVVLEIPDLEVMAAVGHIDESRAGLLAVGQRVEFQLDAHPDRSIGAAIQMVHDTVEPRSPADPSKVVKVEITLDSTDPERMRPGMRFRGEVEVARVEGILCLPIQAPQSGPDGPMVIVDAGATDRRVSPVLGRRDEACYEVLDGLAVGDRVRLSGAPG